MLFRGPSGKAHFATLLQTLYVLQFSHLHYKIVLDTEAHSEAQHDESALKMRELLSHLSLLTMNMGKLCEDCLTEQVIRAAIRCPN
jgi:hypothetical protein